LNVNNHKMPAGQGAPHDAARATGDDAPWRAAPLGAAQRAEHARQLAARHVLRGQPAGAAGERALDALLTTNADAIAQSCDALDHAARAGFTLPPAGARLLQQHHLLDAQIRLARDGLRPVAASLPMLAADGAVRAWRLVLDVVAHGDGRIDADELAQVVSAYQNAAPLRIAELDALPALLRLALIDNLRRLAARAARACAAHAQAAAWASRLVDTAETRPGDLILLVADMMRSSEVGESFVAELGRRLHGRGGALTQVLDWIDARLADGGGSIAQHTQHEHGEQALDAISVGNSLASLRLLGGIDWRAFAEAHGAVDALLRTDPDGSYERMDGATRDSYRHTVARQARTGKQDEVEVAQAALALAGTHRAPGEGGLDVRSRHVGRYLIAPTGKTSPVMRIGATALLTLLFTAAIVVHARQGDAGAWLMALIAVLALPGASELARALVRMTERWHAAPSTTPRMDFSAGIPGDCQTVVAVCAQMGDAAAITRLCEELAVRYLGNRDPMLRFCLLLDLPDAASEAMPTDEALLEQARVAIEGLNEQYGHDGHAPFMLLVRPRTWSIDQQAWIGQERQRGQIADLNAWLCGARSRFLLAAGNTGAGAEVRYVIAQGANAGLPRDAARSLVAAMAHPLHQPVQDDSGRVLEGHGMLLPDRGPAPPGHRAPRFARMWRGGAGTWAGIGAGRGAAQDAGQDWVAIHDVDAWRRAVGDTLQDEGRAMPGLAEQDRLRAGRVVDLRVNALHPVTYVEHMLRRHRALRTAWQEAQQLGRGPHCLQHAHARWHLFDLLRASLVAPATLALLLLCWSLLAAPVFWMAAALAVVFVPALVGMLVALADRPPGTPWRQHLDGWARGARVPLMHTVLWAAFLPHAALVDLDALVRGLWRRHVTQRSLLEMPPVAPARTDRALDANGRAMWFAPLLAVATAMLVSFANPYALFATAPLLLVWFLSPVLAWWTGQVSRRSVRLAPAQDMFLRALARRTWGFFEHYGVTRHGLAPEAVLEHPEPAVDARVSPDGIGLGLLATLSARDFGFISLGGLLKRSEGAFASMALLERWNGHLLHWYDGATLGPIEPRHVDTAASGSLVLALRTFAVGMDELPGQLIAGTEPDGLRAALLVIRDHAKDTPASFQHALDEMDGALAPERCRALDTLPGLVDCLRLAQSNAERLAANLPEDADPALAAWVGRVLEGCEACLQDVYALAPWMRAVQEYVLDARFTRIPTLRELAQIDAPDNGSEGLAQLVDEGRACARARIERIVALADGAREAARMDFSALVDPATGQLAAAYHVRDKRMDSDSCDLLASTSRMASFAAVAQNQLPQQHWWSLGRPLRMAGAGALLLSRRGAMADILAPQLWMPGWRDTLLDGAARALVRAQAAHAKGKGVLWGFSQSRSNAVDAAARYRSGHFGLPAAALQRLGEDDLVAAPYAAALALGVAPGLASANLRALAAQGMVGELGMYEAIDYAPARLPQGERQVVVRAYVARHQAMTILALARHLLGEPMQRRFCRDPEFRAALGLLQEPMPVSGAQAPVRYGAGATTDGMAARPYARVIGLETPALPEVQLLSNGRYHLVVSSDGAGASSWDNVGITRSGAGESGLSCHVRDVASGQVWSSILPFVSAPGDEHETVFAEGRASVHRLHDGIAMRTDVVVAPDDDIELRRIRITNRGLAARTLELTSSVALSGPALEQGGRSNIRIEFDAAADSLLCVTTLDAPVVVHRMAVRDIAPAVTVDTDRARFIGRGHDVRSPQAIDAGGALPGLAVEPDAPLLALRRTVTLDPQQEITVDLVMGVASSRAMARELAARYSAAHAVDRAIDAAWTQAQAFLRRMDISEADAQLYNRLAGCLLQSVPALRADPAVIERNARGRADLLACGIDGAQPVLLLQLADGPAIDADSGLARQVLQAHTYWRSRGFAVDLLVLCDSRAVREQVMGLAMSSVDPDSFDAPGGVHLFLREDVSPEDRILLRSSARVLLLSGRGDLADQLRRAARPGPALPPAFEPAATAQAWVTEELPTVQPERLFDNGIGGFTPDGREYEVRSSARAPVPQAPWVNLLTNADFGSVMSERGHAVTWSGMRDTRLTAGGDDIAPQDGEAFYIRDEDSGAFWSPTPWPAPSAEPYVTRHGVGYTVFEHSTNGIHSALRCFVAPDALLKYSVLLLRNDSDAPRRLSVTGYVAWQLDAIDATPGLQIVTGVDLASGALFARNAFSEDFRDKVGFFHVDADRISTTSDRDEFIGRQGSIAQPAALGRTGLSGAAGAGLDPCAALQASITLAPGAQCELVFVLGVAGPGTLDASREVQLHGGLRAANAAWKRLRTWWDTTLGAVHLQSPDASLNLRVNTWLPYQAITATHGERCPATRLQSLLASVHARPDLLQDALLRAARDFANEQTSLPAPAVDDFLWLPYALTHYLAITGDYALLRALPFAGDAGDAGDATRLAAQDDLYQHCVHGLRGCLRFGKHGLPLAASRLHDDDITGRVESVRLGFFMTTVLQRFAEVADRRGDFGFATTCRGAALALKAQCEEHGWDGEWYRWTWLDSSHALGSIANAACRVELSTQGWAVQAQAEQGPGALRAATQRLVDDANRVLLRCDPPVDGHWSERVAASPGQDHGAVALAATGFARLGDTGHAWQLAGLLDPLARRSTDDDTAPPYFLAGGIRTVAPHIGRAIGGVHTAAAGATWLLMIEALLGMERNGARLHLTPHLAPGWDGFSLRYRYYSAIYEITVRAGDGMEGLLLDGQPCPDWTFELQDDRRDHQVELWVAGTPAGA
jgi:cyclic beta-1,2-glucan synthetase